MTIIQRAVLKAIELHKGEFRKGDNTIPYIVHPLDVAFSVAQHTSDPEFISAAILHDTIEHGKYTLEALTADFGPNVAELVNYLTQDQIREDWAHRKQRAIEKVSQNKVALAIKVHDCLSNMKDLLDAVQKRGDDVWRSFNAPKEQKLKYYQIILERALEFTPASVVKEYMEVYKDLEYAQCEQKTPIGFEA